MAKKRKAAARSKNETGERLKVVDDAITAAIKKIEQRARALPEAASAERRVLKNVVLGLDLTAKLAKLHCGPRWFFLAK